MLVELPSLPLRLACIIAAYCTAGILMASLMDAGILLGDAACALYADEATCARLDWIASAPFLAKGAPVFFCFGVTNELLRYCTWLLARLVGSPDEEDDEDDGAYPWFVIEFVQAMLLSVEWVTGVRAGAPVCLPETAEMGVSDAKKKDSALQKPEEDKGQTLDTNADDNSPGIPGSAPERTTSKGRRSKDPMSWSLC